MTLIHFQHISLKQHSFIEFPDHLFLCLYVFGFSYQYSIFDLTAHKKWSFPLRITPVMWPNPHFPADLVTFTGGILNGKLHFLCSVNLQWWHHQYLSKKSELNSFHLPTLLSTETYLEPSRAPTMDFFGFRRFS